MKIKNIKLIPPEYRTRNEVFYASSGLSKKSKRVLSSVVFFTILLIGFFALPNLIFEEQNMAEAPEFNLRTAIFSSIQPGLLPISADVQKKIEINLRTQRMTLWLDNQVLTVYVISSGKKSTPTKAGNFSVISKYPVAYGDAKGVRWTMPYFLGIYKVKEAENGIHELPYLNGYRESSRSLGIPVSHGCVRVAIGNAEKLYNWADIGTPVWIHY